MYENDIGLDPGVEHFTTKRRWVDRRSRGDRGRRQTVPLGLQSIHLLDRTLIGAGLDDWQAAIQAHERRLENAGGIDLVVHGVGINGHLGFNEPGSSPQSTGRVVELSDSTRASMFAQSAPFRGVTLGLRVLISAKEAILVASGAHKAEAIAKTLNGPISDECPASWLRNTRKTAVILDAAAAAAVQ